MTVINSLIMRRLPFNGSTTQNIGVNGLGSFELVYMLIKQSEYKRIEIGKEREADHVPIKH